MRALIGLHFPGRVSYRRLNAVRHPVTVHICHIHRDLARNVRPAREIVTHRAGHIFNRSKILQGAEPPPGVVLHFPYRVCVRGLHAVGQTVAIDVEQIRFLLSGIGIMAYVISFRGAVHHLNGPVILHGGESFARIPLDFPIKVAVRGLDTVRQSVAVQIRQIRCCFMPVRNIPDIIPAAEVRHSFNGTEILHGRESASRIPLHFPVGVPI